MANNTYGSNDRTMGVDKEQWRQRILSAYKDLAEAFVKHERNDAFGGIAILIEAVSHEHKWDMDLLLRDICDAARCYRLERRDGKVGYGVVKDR